MRSSSSPLLSSFTFSSQPEPYGSGWLLKVKLDNRGELEDLISEEEYAELTTEV